MTPSPDASLSSYGRPASASRALSRRACGPATPRTHTVSGSLGSPSAAVFVLCQKGLPLRHERFAVGPARDCEQWSGSAPQGVTKGPHTTIPTPSYGLSSPKNAPLPQRFAGLPERCAARRAFGTQKAQKRFEISPNFSRQGYASDFRSRHTFLTTSASLAGEVRHMKQRLPCCVALVLLRVKSTHLQCPISPKKRQNYESIAANLSDESQHGSRCRSGQASAHQTAESATETCYPQHWRRHTPTPRSTLTDSIRCRGSMLICDSISRTIQRQSSFSTNLRALYSLIWVFGSIGTENRFKECSPYPSGRVRANKTVNCGHMHPEHLGDLFGRLAFTQYAVGQCTLDRIRLRGSSESYATLLGRITPNWARSRISSRSNSARPANTVIMNLPTCEVVSAHGSESDWNIRFRRDESVRPFPINRV